jgi:4-amino-4-deoxy-L-arabinose transferase-like glycosyltransferase
VGAWALLGLNNITTVPLDVGFDSFAHYHYISYIAEKGRLPLATEGWQMFQSPLYYLISALQQIILAPFFSTEKIQMLLRAIPLVCGAVQVELTYRAVRYAFPAKNYLQVMGTLIGGLLPMNLYLSQVVGNEPLAGVLSSAAIVMTLGLMNSDTSPLSMRRVVLLGIVVGLALLTKVTAILLIPVVMLALLHVMVRKEEPLKRIAGSILALLCVIAFISGWYYLRNWIELGRPFVGGWEPSRGIIWWQDPGYRTLNDFASFGKSLSQPIYSGIYGLWDSLYSTFWMDGFLSGISLYAIRPPWNYTLMCSGALLSLLPSIAIIVGVISVLSGVSASGSHKNLSAYCILLYMAALLYLYVTVPIYSTAKATYTIGLTPCYAIMCAAGLDLLTRNRYLRSAISFLVICWASTVYFSYFVLHHI